VAGFSRCNCHATVCASPLSVAFASPALCQPDYNDFKTLLGVPMKFPRITALFAFLWALSMVAFAGEQDSPPEQAPRISKQTRMELIHLLNAELVYVRSPFPMGKDGLKLHNGVVTPSGQELQQKLAMWGPAAKTGDAARISDVVFKDNFVHIEINGGPIRKQKWYERISVSGGGGGGGVPLTPSDPSANARGSFVDVYFDNYVPEMTGQEFKQMLRPVLDFDAKSPLEAYLEAVPPKVKEAIQNHHVLVGMNHEMVVYAKGRPPNKLREREGEVEYEEWVYGEPPQDVEFVRFVGDEVVRLEIMKVDGQKIVKTEKEIDLETVPKVARENEPRPANAPTLRRPGEEAPADDPSRSTPRTSPNVVMPPPPPPQSPSPGSGPN
jgi:hypothetical protein